MKSRLFDSVHHLIELIRGRNNVYHIYVASLATTGFNKNHLHRMHKVGIFRLNTNQILIGIFYSSRRMAVARAVRQNGIATKSIR